MALVLYAAHKCLTSDSQPIKVGKSVIWIRVQDFGNNITIDEALLKAKEFPEETVLNSIERTVNKNV